MENRENMHKKLGRLLLGGLILSLLAFGLVGCGKKETEESKSGTAQTETGKKASKKDAPDAMVREAAVAIHDAQPEALWAMLPASYQQDVNDVVKQFGTSMDEEVWAKGTALLPKVITILTEKKDIFLAYLAESDGEGTSDTAQTDSAQTGKRYQAFLAILTDVSKSCILKLEFLRNPDMQAFLSEDGAPIIQKLVTFAEQPGLLPTEDMDKFIQNRAKLKNIKVTLVEDKGDQAVVMTEIDDDKTTVALTKVEGKWIPSDMAQDWKQNVTDIKATLTQMAAEIPQKKQQTLQSLTLVNTMLDSVAKVSTKEELSAVMMGLIMMSGSMTGGIPGGDMGAPDSENGMGLGGMMMPSPDMGGMMPPADLLPPPDALPALPGGAAAPQGAGE